MIFSVVLDEMIHSVCAVHGQGLGVVLPSTRLLSSLTRSFSLEVVHEISQSFVSNPESKAKSICNNWHSKWNTIHNLKQQFF